MIVKKHQGDIELLASCFHSHPCPSRTAKAQRSEERLGRGVVGMKGCPLQERNSVQVNKESFKGHQLYYICPHAFWCWTIKYPHCAPLNSSRFFLVIIMNIANFIRGYILSNSWLYSTSFLSLQGSYSVNREELIACLHSSFPDNGWHEWNFFLQLLVQLHSFQPRLHTDEPTKRSEHRTISVCLRDWFARCQQNTPATVQRWTSEQCMSKERHAGLAVRLSPCPGCCCTSARRANDRASSSGKIFQFIPESCWRSEIIRVIHSDASFNFKT